ncbi:hypothetical protein KXX04_005979, partial [Aspergillus fumigatus]
LFLLCDCKVYLLVEHQQEAFVFNSEDFSWPPPDRELEVYCPNVNRLYGSQEIYSRITEDERKDLIQLLICVNALAAGIAKEQGIARTAQSNAIDQPNEVARTVLDQSSETSDSDDDRIEGGLYQDDTRVTGRY